MSRVRMYRPDYTVEGPHVARSRRRVKRALQLFVYTVAGIAMGSFCAGYVLTWAGVIR